MNIKEPIVGVPLSILDTLCSSWELDPETGRIRVIGPKIGDYSSEADRNGKEIARLVERKIPTGEKNLNKRKLNIDGEHTGFEDSGYKKKRSENTSDTDEEEEDNEEEDEEVESGDESNAEVEENNKTTTKDFSEEGESTDIDYSKYYPKREKRNKNKTMDIQKFRKRRRNVEEKGLPTSGRNNILTSAVYRQRREDDLNSNLSKRRKSNTQKLLTLELGDDNIETFDVYNTENISEINDRQSLLPNLTTSENIMSLNEYSKNTENEHELQVIPTEETNLTRSKRSNLPNPQTAQESDNQSEPLQSNLMGRATRSKTRKTRENLAQTMSLASQSPLKKVSGGVTKRKKKLHMLPTNFTIQNLRRFIVE